MRIRTLFLALMLAATLIGGASHAHAATAEDLDMDARQTLLKLTQGNVFAKNLSLSAQSVLIFPHIVKAGPVFGGGYGEGELLHNDVIDGNYSSLTASWGAQAGAQSYGYVIFLMTDSAVTNIHDAHGLEIGVGPSVVMVNDDVAKNLESSTLKDDAYAFVFGPQGLANITLTGTKIARLRP